MRFCEMRRIRRSRQPHYFNRLFARLRATEPPDDTTIERWRVHGTVRHAPFKEARQAIERREERRFVRHCKAEFFKVR